MRRSDYLLIGHGGPNVASTQHSDLIVQESNRLAAFVKLNNKGTAGRPLSDLYIPHKWRKSRYALSDNLWCGFLLKHVVNNHSTVLEAILSLSHKACLLE
ncbi:hypothetical protein AB6A40_001818 [Gnathostoma spinigerum]|uniref:Uncharacterized protein n=1 Tax=Gnathostoma spinigerum TaxID=75299 RepID=A0ABD6ECR6_9BILA